MTKKALYLSGGGAKGAYQAGALNALGHLLQTKTIPFNIISGVSVGSINAAVLAEHADNFPMALEKLKSIWSEIHCQQIYKASNLALGKSFLRNFANIFVKKSRTGHLLDTTPLQSFVQNTIDFNKIEENIKNNHLEALEVLTVCYETHQTISFYQHHQTHFENWSYPRHSSQQGVLSADHVLASSALPLFFPPVSIDGFHYGDGSIGLVAPLRGAIRFEVDKILVLGTREVAQFKEPSGTHQEISFADVLGAMLNGLFLDNLDRDIEMVNRMNEISMLMSMWKKHRATWRPISTLYLSPSRSMASYAQKHYTHLPLFLRYFLNMLGAQSHSGDLLSFLLFEKSFTRELFKLGYKDTLARAPQIMEFFD